MVFFKGRGVKVLVPVEENSKREVFFEGTVETVSSNAIKLSGKEGVTWISRKAMSVSGELGFLRLEDWFAGSPEQEAFIKDNVKTRQMLPF